MKHGGKINWDEVGRTRGLDPHVGKACEALRLSMRGLSPQARKINQQG